MNIYIIYNYWEILLSLLVLENSKNEDSILLIVENEIEEKIISRLEEKYKIIKFNFSPNRILRFLFFYYKVNYFLPHKLNFLLSNVKRIVSFSDHDAITQYFIKNKKYVDLYEHGGVNYKVEFNEIDQKIKEIIFRMKKPYGRSEYVRNIYLRGTGKIPEDIKEKVKLIELEELWNTIDKESRNRILEIFGLDLKKLEAIGRKSVILFTQPFSEDRVITEKEKIDLYKKIVKNYNRNELIIKNHPREKTNYEKIFSDITILERGFPSELLTLVGIKIKKVITISSTAISIFSKKAEIDFYGTEIHPKILKYFGNIDFFMKRNKFIDKE